jgi:multiple sugar transport system substrate-binding protein
MSLAHNPLSRRRLLALGGLAAAGAGLAACGSNTGTNADKGGKSLAQWYHQYGEAGTQQAALKYAAAYDKAKVNVTWIPSEYDAKLASALLSNDGPDVFESHFNVAMAKSKQVVPLDDIIGDLKSDFSDVDVQANSWDGKLYGIRMIDDPQLLYYRKSVLDKAGIKPPATFDELIAAAKALTTKTQKGLFVSNNGGYGPINGPALYTTGQNYLTADNKVGFDSDKTVEMLLKLKELHNSKALLTGAPTDWWDPSAFNQGLAAMTWNGLWAMPGIIKAIGEDFGVLPLPPVLSDGKPAIYNGGWTTFVSAKAKDVDAAKAFVKWLWLDKKEYQEDWCLNYGFHIPPRKSLAATATKLTSGNAAEVVKLAGQYGVGDQPAFTSTMGTAYGDMVTNVVAKGADAKTELATAVKKVNDELAKVLG